MAVKSTRPTIESLIAERNHLRETIEALLHGWYDATKGSGPVYAKAREEAVAWGAESLRPKSKAKPKPTPQPTPALTVVTPEPTEPNGDKPEEDDEEA